MNFATPVGGGVHANGVVSVSNGGCSLTGDGFVVRWFSIQADLSCQYDICLASCGFDEGLDGDSGVWIDFQTGVDNSIRDGVT